MIITTEKLAFESICFKQDISGNSLPLRFQEFPQAIDCARYALANHRVISGDFDISTHALHERLELLLADQRPASQLHLSRISPLEGATDYALRIPRREARLGTAERSSLPTIG
jgi:hypothetical protein